MRLGGVQQLPLTVLQVIGPRPAGHHGEAPGQAEAELSSKLKHPNIVETLMFNSFRADKVGRLLHHHQLSSWHLKHHQVCTELMDQGANSTLFMYGTACSPLLGSMSCTAAFESSAGVQGAREEQDSAEDAAPPPREKSFCRSRSKDDRPMWETWILREAWDKGSLEVGAVHTSSLQAGSPDLLLPGSACCDAGWHCLDRVRPHSQQVSVLCLAPIDAQTLCRAECCQANPPWRSLVPCRLASRHLPACWPPACSTGGVLRAACSMPHCACLIPLPHSAGPSGCGRIPAGECPLG